MNLVLPTEAEVATDLRDLKEEAPPTDFNNALGAGVADLTLLKPPLPPLQLHDGGMLLLPPFPSPLSTVLPTLTIVTSDPSSTQ